VLGKLTIGHPWSSVTHGAAQTSAVYITVINDGPADTLLKVSTPFAKQASLHANMKEGTVNHMHALERVEIPAGATTQLEPGGMHIMLEGIEHPLKEGDMFPLTLTFAKAGEVKVDVMVSDN
jgi:copper(I)-binding protein